MSEMIDLKITTGLSLSWVPGTSDIMLYASSPTGTVAAIALAEIENSTVREAFYEMGLAAHLRQFGCNA